MINTTDVRPVRERLAKLTRTSSDAWREPIGRLFGLRSRLVHGETENAPAEATALVELVARTLLYAQLLHRVPAETEAALLSASGVPPPS